MTTEAAQQDIPLNWRVPTEEIAANAVIQADMGNGRALTLNLNIGNTDTVASINAKLDTALSIVQRQRYREDLEGMRAKRDQMIRQKAQWEKDLPEFRARADEIAKSIPGGKRKTQDEHGIRNLEENIKRAQDEVETAEKIIAELVEKAR